MLLGREEERLALDRLLAEARSGRSGVLAFVGEPGIGKTALVDYAAGRAEGMRVLRARGIESEAEVPFGGLLELLRPALDALERIPEPQAEALAGALALRPARAQDRFAVGAATLGLLAACAEETPLLLLVDDAHWLDASSAEALLFAIRRLVADAIAVVLAAREDEASLLDGADLRVLRLGGLDRAAAAELLGVDSMLPQATDSLYRATGGNPLALLELAGDASRAAEVRPGAPVPLSTSIAQAFLRRAGTLDEDTRRMLLLAAASETGELALLARAASSLGLEVGALERAEAAGLVRIADGAVEFRHPLVRSAVYADAPARDRREAHRALASTLPDRDVDRRAWHLAAASIGPDEAASAALQQAGERARERSAYAVAAAAFERAARLAPGDDPRAHLLLAAADAAWLGGLAERAAALLVEARVHTADPVLVARIEYLRGHLTIRRGPVMDGHAVLVAAAEEIAEQDPALAVLMLADAVHACFYAANVPAMLAAAERAYELVPAAGDARTEYMAVLALGVAKVMAAQPAMEHFRRAVELVDSSGELPDDPRLLVWATMAPLFLREAEAGRAMLERVLELARVQSAVGGLPYLLNQVARDDAMTDRWPEAEARYHEAVALARETGQRTELAAVLSGLAWLEAREGKAESCRAHAGEARSICAELGIGLYDVWAVVALGELELGLGRTAEALDLFEEQARALRARGVLDVDLSPGPELVECYLRLGRREDAAAVASEYGGQAAAKGQPWALARAARCRGLLAADGELDEHFGEALRLHERTPDTFELARTRLSYGARLRRARQRVRAREELRSALELFDGLGAAPWAELASAELAATGETARRRDPSTLGDLTPQELQIALLLAGGSTTREAAAKLFLSPKTIEYHLRNVYRKLGVRSRDELARALAA